MNRPLFLRCFLSLPWSLSLLFLFLCYACSGPSDPEKAGKGGQGGSKELKEGEGEEAIALFFGNSLTAGSGVGTEEAFPALVQDKVDSLGWAVEIVNSGVSGQTSSGGLGRIDWVLEQHEVDLFLLELGANDGLRGIDPSETRKNLQRIIDKVRKAYPNARIVLAGMKVPPNMGPEYAEEFESIFPELAKKNGIERIPFLLKGVAGVDSLNQSDGIHPTAEGHRIVARTVWKAIRDDLKQISKKGRTASDRRDHL
jgi:acyl-CoA thioesterase-1